MQKQATPRQRAELARRKAMPIALIQRPLKHIAERDSEKVTGPNGVIRIVMGPTYEMARQHANAGNGAAVQRMARMV